jgi:kynurenine formamidase
MKIIDLSVALDDTGISLVPGHPGFHLHAFFSHDLDHRCSSYLQMSTHTGTHVDAPSHFVKDGQTVSELKLDDLVGTAVMVDLRRVVSAGRGISVEQLRGCAAHKVIRGRIVVLHSGWLRQKWGTEEMYSGNPFLLEDAA